MKKIDIPEAMEGSVITSRGYTYYVDKNTEKCIRIAPDGSKEVMPASNGFEGGVDIKDCLVSGGIRYSERFTDDI